MIRCTQGVLIVLLFVTSGCGGPGALSVAPASNTADGQARWHTSWSTAHTGKAPAIADQTLRMVLQLSAGGDEVRVKLRNKFGTEPVIVDAASVGIIDSGASLKPGSRKALTFFGSTSAVIEAGEDLLSDPVVLPTQAQQFLGISLFISGTAAPSQDSLAYVTSYLTPAGAGSSIDDDSGMAFTSETPAMILVGSVEVQDTSLIGTVIGVGGSTTDGVGSDGKFLNAVPSPAALLFPQPDCHPCRWTDFLARRILAELPPSAQLSVGNEGIASNTTTDVLERYDADVLDHPNLTHVILYSGANDLGAGVGDDADTIVTNLKTAIDRAHAVGVKVIAATINPRSSFTPLQNIQRQIVNTWIRAKGNCDGYCDGFVDFDAALAWPLDPNVMNPVYDSGDNVHPTPAGYKVMVDSIDLGLFR